MMFSLDYIKTIMKDTEQDTLSFLENHRQDLQSKTRELKLVASQLEAFIHSERLAQNTYALSHDTIQVVLLPSLVYVSIRLQGKYSDPGPVFGKLAKKLRQKIMGKPFTIFHDLEYKEVNADFECAFPVKKSLPGSKTLSSIKALSLIHKGPYEQLGRSCARLFSHVSERGLKIPNPTREVNLKGPGMLFKGNPQNYVTEIQMEIID